MSERDEFEAWAGRNFLDVTRNRGMVIDYVKPDTQLAWLAWQAARVPQAVPALTDEKILEIAKSVRIFAYTDEVIDFAQAIRDYLAAPQPSPEPARQQYQD